MSKTVQAHVLKEFTLVKQMGSGAYGHVWHVLQKNTQKQYALKKVFDAFRNSIDAQRTYREVQILKQLNHQNIVKLFRVIKSKNKKDLYLVFEFMEADLHSVVGSNVLQKMHQIYVFYQSLKALKYIHSAELIHRDLKPSNILLNSQCQVKICDFGLVRSLNSQLDQENILSEQVATKWYRAPQLLLGSRSYKKPIDMWSFGCIVAQILTGKPMFTGDSTLSQLQKIMEFTGNLSEQDIQSLDSPVAQQLIQQIKIKKKQFRQYFSSVDKEFYQLLRGTLQFNPNKRLSVQEALQLPLFNQFNQEKQRLKICDKPIKPLIDDNIRFGLKIYRQKIYEQINNNEWLDQNAKQQNIINKIVKRDPPHQQKRYKSQSIKKRIVSHDVKHEIINNKKQNDHYYSNKKLANSSYEKDYTKKHSAQKKGKNSIKFQNASLFSPYYAYLQSCKNKVADKQIKKQKSSLVNIKNYFKSCQFIKCNHKPHSLVDACKQKLQNNTSSNSKFTKFKRKLSNKGKHQNQSIKKIYQQSLHKKMKPSINKEQQVMKEVKIKSKQLKKKNINRTNILKNIGLSQK